MVSPGWSRSAKKLSHRTRALSRQNALGSEDHPKHLVEQETGFGPVPPESTPTQDEELYDHMRYDIDEDFEILTAKHVTEGIVEDSPKPANGASCAPCEILLVRLMFWRCSAVASSV